MNKTPYFGVYDFQQVVGDKLQQAFNLEVDGVPFSFTGYTIVGTIKDVRGEVVTTLSFALSTTVVADDTVTATALPASLPTRSGLYSYEIKYSTDSTDTRTLVFGKIAFIQ